MKVFSYFLVVCALLLAGCGGSGGSGSVLSKDQLAALLGSSVNGMGNLASIPANRSNRSVKVGAVKHGISPKSRAASQIHRGDQALFDDAYGLWYVEFSDGNTTGEHTWGKHYFVDEQMTQPAGSDVWTSNWDVWPNTDDEVFSLTEGPMAGLRIEEHDRTNEDGTGSSSGLGNIPDVYSYTYTLSWDEGELARIDEKFTNPDGTWTRYQGIPNDDGADDWIISNSSGITFHLHFTWDGSGTGTITGPGPALPATLEWDSDQVGDIHWADGTTTHFEGWNF